MSATTNNSDVSHDPHLVEIDDELHPAWAATSGRSPAASNKKLDF